MENIYEEICGWRRKNLVALWITENCTVEDARALLSLDWPLVWSSLSAEALRQSLEARNDRYHIIHSRAELPPDGHRGDLRYIYNVAQEQASTPSAFLQQRRAAELENLLEGWVGSVVVAGKSSINLDNLIAALAPAANTYHITSDLIKNKSSSGIELANFLFESELVDEEVDTLDLKNAKNVEFDRALLEPISDSWQLLTGRILKPTLPIEQEDFDDFLSGESYWRALSTGVATERGAICKTEQATADPIKVILRRVRQIDKLDLDPGDALSRIRIFAETGSGCTTVLRQAALAVARAGYPVLITQPFTRVLRASDVSRLIINIQDEWALRREGKGSGSGTLPFCIILDSDAELSAHSEGFIRLLSNELHRKIVVVTAHRRSRDEIDQSKKTLKLYARTSKKEILSIGKLLREYCLRWKLSSIPSDSDWEIYYNSFGRIWKHDPLPAGGPVQAQALFLVGLYPFVKERVRDERSLTRYLYRQWSNISDLGLKQLIEVLAVAAAYGCAIPLECLMREPKLRMATTTKQSKEDDRASDIFIEWAKFGGHTRNWALHIRHPALGLLLVKAILPNEAIAPFSPLLPVLELMSGSLTDIWLAEQLAFRLGQYFQSGSPRFSLEIDTPVQQAARNIFDGIPVSVSNQSRVVNHHHARYYIHLLHACLELLQDLKSTPLSKHTLIETSRRALECSEELLETAREIPQSHERTSNLLTTLAAASLRMAGVVGKGDKELSQKYFCKAIKLGREAVSDDVANGHAIFTYINSVQKFFDSVDLSEITPNETLRLFVSAEDLIHALFELQESRLWRNVEAEDAELSIHKLVEEHNKLAQRLGKSPILQSFIIKTPGAKAALAMRRILQGQSISQAFMRKRKAEDLRKLREELSNSPMQSELLDLRYRLYVCDPVGRFDFATRNEILDEMALQKPDEYVHYLHDHAAIAFQLKQIERSDELFQQLRKYKVQEPQNWVWHNERIFIKQTASGIEPCRVVIRIVDAIEGWATYDKRIKVKIQPRQWGEIANGDYRKVFLRFRMTGLQAVDKRFAANDLAAMGIRSGQI